MPELPEVEVQARNLAAWLSGRRVTAARVARSRIVRGSTPGEVERLLLSGRIGRVERRGKWIRIAAGGGALFSHLGMTGKWIRRPAGEEARHERARVDAGRVSVRYVDPRMFGRLLPSPSGAPIPEWERLGRDPLVDGLDAAWLAAALAGRRAPIKVVLADQAVIAGLGNIQATEALWRARLHPARSAGDLDAGAVRRLLAAIRGTLADTLREESGPEIAYVEEPGARNPFAVYGKAGHPCPRCRARLARMVLAGRTTAWCPRCQRG